MKRSIVSGLLMAGLAAGCGGERAPEKREGLQLTVNLEVRAYDPEAAGPKGSGDVGQAEKPLKLGERVIAECVDRPDSDYDGKGNTDAIRLGNTVFVGQLVSLQAYTQDQNGQMSDKPSPVFNLSPDEIRARLDFCQS